jgi:hypothetical protein
MKFRTIVTAYRRTDRTQSAERCVYLEAASPQEAEETAKTVLKLIYAECDAFDAFNTLSEQEDRDAVLRFVIGAGQGEKLICRDPIVLFREQIPAEWVNADQLFAISGAGPKP